MKKYQEPIINYAQIFKGDILTVSGDNLADGLVEFDKIPGEL